MRQPIRVGMKRLFLFFYHIFASIFFDPLEIVQKWSGIPSFIRNLMAYRQSEPENQKFKISLRRIFPILHDRFASAGAAQGHYFFQDIWAAQIVYSKGTKHHVDVGSRLDGFVAHLLPFCRVTYVDIRPLKAVIDGLEVRQGSVIEMPFPDDSLASVSCLHVIEHVGLGRYGDPVDPNGYVKAAKELTRVLAPGGMLLIGVPVGKERLCFDAHRVFDPQTVVDVFGDLSVKSFSLIDDHGDCIHVNASFAHARRCDYGCGLFVLKK